MLKNYHIFLDSKHSKYYFSRYEKELLKLELSCEKWERIISELKTGTKIT